MSLNGSIETAAYQASDGTRTLVLEWSAEQSGPGDNYSDVSWVFRGGGTSSQGINCKNCQCQVGGTHWSNVGESAKKIYNGTVLASGIERIYHTTDGSASFYTGVSGYIYYYGAQHEKTANHTWTLDPINRYFTLDIGTYIDGVIDDTGGQLTFDLYLNGSIDSNDAEDWCQSLLYGTTYSIADVKAKHGYEYEGVYSGELSGTITGTTSIYLKVNTITCTLNFDGNNGVGVPESATFTYATGYVLPSTVPLREGYNFLGWSIDKNAETATYMPGQRWSDYTADNITLYAVWVAVHEIMFDGNGGFINGNEFLKQTAVDGTAISNFPTASKAHHKFVGWNTSLDGKGEYCENLIVTKNIVLYAIYQVESNCCLKKNGTHKRGVAYVRKNGVYRKAIKNRRYKK